MTSRYDINLIHIIPIDSVLCHHLSYIAFDFVAIRLRLNAVRSDVVINIFIFHQPCSFSPETHRNLEVLLRQKHL